MRAKAPTMWQLWARLSILQLRITHIGEINKYHNKDKPGNETGKDENAFWQLDEQIGEGRFFREQATIRLKAHISEEPYHPSEGKEIVSISKANKTRIYVMARPYILVPDYEFIVGLYPQPTEEGAIGEVFSSDWVGMKQQEIGQAQAWLYPEEHTLILWECFLEDWCREKDPCTDETLNTLWLGFESFLLRHLPPVERIATPSWEPLYEENKEAWPSFLETVGYKRTNDRAYTKDVAHEEH